MKTIQTSMRKSCTNNYFAPMKNRGKNMKKVVDK